MDRQPDIFDRSLREQAERLILGPFRLIGDQGGTVKWPKIIIIDGLDEVVATQDKEPTHQHSLRTAEGDQVEILDVLLTLSQSPSFPFRIFIASRPERAILRGLICTFVFLFIVAPFSAPTSFTLSHWLAFLSLRCNPPT